MDIRFLYIISFLLLSFSVMQGQPALTTTVSIENEVNDKTFVLNSIEFKGNKKTNSEYLSNELNLEKGKQYTFTDLEYKVRRLQRLNGLYDSSFEYSIDRFGGLNLIVSVSEQRTLLPVFNFGLQENNRWFQIGIVDINLRGRGDELYAYYQNNNGRHSAQLYYKNNHVLNTNLGYHINILRWHSLEPLNFGNQRLQYEYQNNLFSTGLHYRLSDKHMFEYSIATFKEVYEKGQSSADIAVGPDLLQLDKVLNKFEYNLDLLKYDQIYLQGSRLMTRFQSVLTFQNNEMFNIFEAEYKYYTRPSPRSNIAFRSTFGLATNNSSPFSPFVLDSYQNIRGIGDRVLRGTALLTANLEWRYTLKHYLFNKSKNWSTQVITFIDAGLIRTPGLDNSEILSNDNHREAIGIGGRLHYKKIYNAVLRVDYGFELESKRSHFVIGLGQYF